MKSDAPFKAAEGETPRCCPACGTPYADGNDVLGQFRATIRDITGLVLESLP
jgi:hypothetical protein